MSDCKAICRKVKGFVKCLYPREPRGFFHRNLNPNLRVPKSIEELFEKTDPIGLMPGFLKLLTTHLKVFSEFRTQLL
jgi:hypothetical protein